MAMVTARGYCHCFQCFGSVFKWCGSGSGSSILGWIPIRIWIQSGFRVLMTKNWKKFTAEKKIIFGSKTTIYLFLDPNKGFPSYGRSLRPSKENIHGNYWFFSTFVGHFCPPGSWYGSTGTDLIESGSNTDPKHWLLLCRCGNERKVTMLNMRMIMLTIAGWLDAPPGRVSQQLTQNSEYIWRGRQPDGKQVVPHFNCSSAYDNVWHTASNR